MPVPSSLRPLALGLLMAALAVPLGLQAQTSTAGSEPVGRVIVRFKASAQSVRAQALSAVTDVSTARQVVRTRALGLGLRTGLSLGAHHSLDGLTQVVIAKGLSSEALAARLSRDAEVAFVAVDQRRHRAAVPNDPLYPVVNPAQGSDGHGQWYLMPPGGEVVSSINAQSAWDRSTGSSSVVVAVLDTGLRYDHPDLSGKLITQGYDMIGAATTASDAPAVANDGQPGADADASDPGDWITVGEANDSGSPFYHCGDQDSQGHYIGSASSWHGTRVAGLIGAATNNGLGIAGVSWGSRILPVRALGKCGGYDSDIIAGMRWAAGIAVPGVPVNANPAKVLNMSLGGGGSCNDGSGTATLYNETVAAIRAKGAVIVAAAGNSTGQAVGIPGNCSGVITVAGLRHAGTKVGFSSLGTEVVIAAPGGNCVNSTGACLYPILSTTNSGRQGPVANDNAYTDSSASVGTSFSAPLVAGTAALLYSARPSITPDQVRSVLTATSRPFITPPGGSGSTTPVCQAPSAAEQLECYCTTSTCGAGMLDANAAVRAVAPQFTLGTSTGSPQAGQSLTLSLTSDGRSLRSYSWSVVDGVSVAGALSGASTATPSLTPAAAGSFTVKVDVVDDLGLSHSHTASVTVLAGSGSSGAGGSGGSGGGGGGGLMSPAWLLALLATVPALRRQRRH